MLCSVMFYGGKLSESLDAVCHFESPKLFTDFVGAYTQKVVKINYILIKINKLLMKLLLEGL